MERTNPCPVCHTCSWPEHDPTGLDCIGLALSTDNIGHVELTRGRQNTNFYSLPESTVVAKHTEKSDENQTVSSKRQKLLWNVITPLCLLTLSNLLASITLISLIARHIVTESRSIFAGISEPMSCEYFLVDYSATSLTNISSILSTLAPFLVGFMMALWIPCVVRSVHRACQSQRDPRAASKLPNAFDFSLLVAMCSALHNQLWKYAKRVISNFRHQNEDQITPIVHRTAGVLFLGVFLAVLTFIADQIFHITTVTILANQFQSPTANIHQFGRGLTERCLTINRTENYGLPCTWDWGLPAEYSEGHIERRNLYRNTSRRSELRVLTDSKVILLPSYKIIPAQIDYRARTIGASTQCQFITPKCHLRSIQVDTKEPIYTQFNCTGNFWGVLGKPPNTTANFNIKAQDSDVPGLAWKPSRNLEYGFFADADLKVPYNTIGLDPKTGLTDDNRPPLPNSQLVNPVYLAIAGRILSSEISAGSLLSKDPGLQSQDKGLFYDFILNCSYTTYDVEYTKMGATIEDFSFSPSPNGTAAEMWHGAQTYTSFDGDPSGCLLETIYEAALESTGENFSKYLSDVYSKKVLSQIGAFTSPRTNIQEEHRSEVLLTRIHKGALGFSLCCSFIYVILGIGLGGLAYWNARYEPYKLLQEIDINTQVTGKFHGSLSTSRRVSSNSSNARQTTSAVTREPRVGVVGTTFGVFE